MKKILLLLILLLICVPSLLAADTIISGDNETLSFSQISGSLIITGDNATVTNVTVYNGNIVCKGASPTITNAIGFNGAGDGSTVVVNGTMEADANWSNVGTPATNERSSEQVHGGTYSRKLVSDSINDGITSDTYTVPANTLMRFIFSVYANKTRIRSKFVEGNGATVQSIDHTITAGTWNSVEVNVFCVNGGAGAFVYFQDVWGDNGTYYIDDVVVVTDGTTDIFIASGVTVTGTYNLFGDSAKVGGGTYSDGSSTTKWSSDPLFVSATDFNLKPGSPALWNGTSKDDTPYSSEQDDLNGNQVFDENGNCERRYTRKGNCFQGAYGRRRAIINPNLKGLFRKMR